MQTFYRVSSGLCGIIIYIFASFQDPRGKVINDFAIPDTTTDLPHYRHFPDRHQRLSVISHPGQNIGPALVDGQLVLAIIS